jgi:hypothetical protein
MEVAAEVLTPFLTQGIYVSSSACHGISEEKRTQRLSWSNVPPKGTLNSSIEIYPLLLFRYICSVQQLK